MRKILLGALLLCLIACTASDSFTVNPSGVWQFQGRGNMNYKKVYSWGENPTYNQATVIDLGDAKPYIDTEWGRFYVVSKQRKGGKYIFSGIWGEEGEKGSKHSFYRCRYNVV
jgi:hypothetical protein